MVSKSGKSARKSGEKMTETVDEAATTETENTEIVRYSEKNFSDAQLSQVKGFADAAELIGEGAVNVADVLGTGFGVLPTNEKDKLLGEGFIVLEYKEHEGNKGNFVTLLVVTHTDQKYVINDGGTGIPKQLKDLTDNGHQVIGLFVPKGLRKSVYDHPEYGESVTYYLNTSA